MIDFSSNCSFKEYVLNANHVADTVPSAGATVVNSVFRCVFCIMECAIQLERQTTEHTNSE